MGSIRQQINSLWQNYRHIVILLGITMLMVAGVLIAFASRGTDIAFAGLLVDVPITEEGSHYLQQGYEQSFSLPEKKVHITEISLMAPGGVEKEEPDYGGAVYALTMVANREVDYFLLDETALKIFLPQCMFADLQTVFSEEFLQSQKDMIIQAAAVDENGQPTQTGVYPVALDISGLPFAQHCLSVDGPIYLCFVAESVHKDQFMQFWDYLNTWRP